VSGEHVVYTIGGSGGQKLSKDAIATSENPHGHCGCVPELRERVAELEDENAKWQTADSKAVADLRNELDRKTAEATAFYMEATNARQRIAELEAQLAKLEDERKAVSDSHKDWKEFYGGKVYSGHVDIEARLEPPEVE
jgi:polyhydroxyalkanoate synthesis regulator phasin